MCARKFPSYDLIVVKKFLFHFLYIDFFLVFDWFLSSIINDYLLIEKLVDHLKIIHVIFVVLVCMQLVLDLIVLAKSLVD